MREIWPFRHIGLKLASIGLALLLWLTISGQETVERGMHVPLELREVPSNVKLLGDVPATVEVRVRGASGTMNRLLPGDIVAVIDLRSVAPGRRVFALAPSDVRVPFGINVVQVTPAAVALVFGAIDGRPSASPGESAPPAADHADAPAGREQAGPSAGGEAPRAGPIDIALSDRRTTGVEI
jgi:hypothetical protein